MHPPRTYDIKRKPESLSCVTGDWFQSENTHVKGNSRSPELVLLRLLETLKRSFLPTWSHLDSFEVTTCLVFLESNHDVVEILPTHFHQILYQDHEGVAAENS